MPAIAAIDVGSNAMRMAVARVNGNKELDMLESIREPVRLGQDVFTNGNIGEETLERSLEAFSTFKKLMEKHDVKWRKAVGTSATREAQNKDLFIDRIAMQSGIEIQVIDSQEEARLIHLAVASKINLKNKLAMLVDIGGGSVEITLTEGENMLLTESFNMGTVRLLQVLGGKKQGTKHFNQLVQQYVDATHRRLKKELGNEKIDVCAGTGGNIECLGDLRKQLLEKENRSVVKLDEMDAILKKLQNMSYEERVKDLGLRPDRADVIVPASIVLQKIMKQAGVDEIVIPDVGLKDGLLLDIVQEMYEDKTKLSRAHVVSSAMLLGRKFSFDEPHAAAVAKFAVKLFDETQFLHNLDRENRLLLEVAALLHDIGQFVDVAGHHKHSYYLLMASPLSGLSKTQKAIVANVARYHRKSAPKPHHENFKELSSRDRMAASKLAALLRCADSMDKEHGNKVSDFTVEYKKPKLKLSLEGEGDMLLEKWALANKAAPFFEEVFSARLVLDE